MYDPADLIESLPADDPMREYLATTAPEPGSCLGAPCHDSPLLCENCPHDPELRYV